MCHTTQSNCSVDSGSLQGPHSSWEFRRLSRGSSGRIPLLWPASIPPKDFSLSRCSPHAHACVDQCCMCACLPNTLPQLKLIWFPLDPVLLKTRCTCIKTAQNYTHTNEYTSKLAKSESAPQTVPMLISWFWYCVSVTRRVTLGETGWTVRRTSRYFATTCDSRMIAK